MVSGLHTDGKEFYIFLRAEQFSGRYCGVVISSHVLISVGDDDGHSWDALRSWAHPVIYLENFIPETIYTAGQKGQRVGRCRHAIVQHLSDVVVADAFVHPQTKHSPLYNETKLGLLNM